MLSWHSNKDRSINQECSGPGERLSFAFCSTSCWNMALFCLWNTRRTRWLTGWSWWKKDTHLHNSAEWTRCLKEKGLVEPSRSFYHRRNPQKAFQQEKGRIGLGKRIDIKWKEPFLMSNKRVSGIHSQQGLDLFFLFGHKTWRWKDFFTPQKR